jgi:hypothetical protein
MPLSDADLTKIGELFDTKFKTIQENFTSALDKLGKRLSRVESGFALLADVARKVVIEEAHNNHDRLLRGTFDKSDLLALPLLVDYPQGGKTREAVMCSADDVAALIAEEVGNNTRVEVELAKPAGFRILVSSRSPQTRRRVAGGIMKKCKSLLDTKYKLHLQYDKPFELRALQKKGHKFLGTVKRYGGSGITSTEAKQGFLLVNGVRIAPEYLVPANRHWDKLVDMVKTKIRGLGPHAIVPECGCLYDVFGSALAADKGVFDLDDIPVDEDTYVEAAGGENMDH